MGRIRRPLTPTTLIRRRQDVLRHATFHHVAITHIHVTVLIRSAPSVARSSPPLPLSRLPMAPHRTLSLPHIRIARGRACPRRGRTSPRSSHLLAGGNSGPLQQQAFDKSRACSQFLDHHFLGIWSYDEISLVGTNIYSRRSRSI